MFGYFFKKEYRDEEENVLVYNIPIKELTSLLRLKGSINTIELDSMKDNVVIRTREGKKPVKSNGEAQIEGSSDREKLKKALKWWD